MHIQEVARRLGASVDPDLDLDITGVAPIEAATAGELTFLANPRYEVKLASSEASAVLVDPGFEGDVPPAPVRIANPYLAFAKAISLFHEPACPPARVHPTVVLGEDVTLGDDVSIGAYVVIGDRVKIGNGAVIHPHAVVYADAEIGDGSILHSHVSVRDGVRLGKGVILQNGVVVGGDGFGFAPRGDGTWHKIPQVGIVELADEVEMQANACIDRAAVGSTTVGPGTKIDNLAQIGHGCHIGANTLVCGQVGLAGSTVVGDRVTLAGQVGVAGHLRIHDDVICAAMTGVGHDLKPEGSIFGGRPAIPIKNWRESAALYRKLPQMLRRLRALERKVAADSR